VDWKDWPLWAHILRRLLPILVLSGFAWHAHMQCRHHGKEMLTSERMTFQVFSFILPSGVLANFVAIFYTLHFNLTQGPEGFGIFSLLLAVVYLIFFFRSARRVRF
jgi:hypothetical protein